MTDFEGKVVLVTGSGRGIGRAIARAFLDQGALVVGATLEADNDNGFSGELQSRYFHRPTDVTDQASVAGLLGWIDSTFGRLDSLVNNAGHHPPQQTIDGATDDSLRALLELNLVAPFRLCRDTLPALREASGSIVNIGSASGMHGQDGSAAYSATKGALAALTKALAIDEGPRGVRVNCVSPGAIDSPATQTEHSPEEQELIARWGVLGRLGRMAEVANVVVFLASHRASFITGEEVAVTGGAATGYGVRVHLPGATVNT